MKFTTLRKTLVLLALVIAAAVPVCALTGSGTSSDPYVVTTVADLEAIGNNPSAYYSLGANIYVNDPAVFEYENGAISGVKDGAAVVEWEPIDFSGTFVNNSTSKYFIAGLYVTEDNTNGGLFATLTDATVDGLYLYFAFVESDEYAGVLAGKAEGKTTISNTVVSGSVAGMTTKEMNTVGGLVGYLGEDATVDACASYADVTGATSYSANVGGLVGLNHGTVTNSGFGGNAYGTATYYDAAIGGIAGYNTGSVSNCRTNYLGTVGGESTAFVNDCYVGGIVGLNKGTVEYNVNEAAVSARTYSSGDSIVAAGGIVGATIDADISENKNTGAVSGEYAYLGGIAGVAVSDSGEMTVSACDNEGAVTSTYGVAGGIVGRAAAAGEGYVSIKLYVQECNNTGTLNGNATEEVAAETANVESASVTIGAEESTYSGTCTAKAFSAPIVADEVQYAATVTVYVNETKVRNGSLLITGATDRYIARYHTNSTTEFVPEPTLITLVKVTDADELEILDVDTTALSLSGTTLSGTVVVKVYKPATFTGGTAVTGFSAGNKYAATDFTTLKAVSEGRIEEVEVPVNVTVEAGSTITVNALVVDATEAMNPLCENKKVSK